jgi:hypothetical protein
MPAQLFASKQMPKSELYCYQQIWESNPDGPSQDPTQPRFESAGIAWGSASLSCLQHFCNGVWNWSAFKRDLQNDHEALEGSVNMSVATIPVNRKRSLFFALIGRSFVRPRSQFSPQLLLSKLQQVEPANRPKTNLQEALRLSSQE